MKINGIITAMVTPFDQNGNLYLPAVGPMLKQMIRSGISGVFILGTNGEAYSLTREEKLAFAQCVIEKAAGRIPVYVGTGENSTRETIRLSLEMQKLGADVLSVITPSFVTLSQEELYRHYQMIAEAVDLPICLYNMPRYTNMNISPELLARLAKLPHITAIKDSSGDLNNTSRYIEVTGKDFSVLSGSDGLILKALEKGAAGAVAATANLIPEIDVAVYELFRSGKTEAAGTYQERIDVLRNVLHLGTAPSVLKRTMDIGGDKKLPFFDLCEDNPFLGVRGVRLSLREEKVFCTQLRALLRASVYGKLKVMIPMAGSLDEIRRTKKLLAKEAAALDAAGIPRDPHMQFGVMIEIPSIVLTADLIAEEVDFASVGTNDLTQYLCAADRMNPLVNEYYQEYHPAVFRILRHLSNVFSAAGKDLSICGELGGDPLAIPALAGLGIRPSPWGKAPWQKPGR